MELILKLKWGESRVRQERAFSDELGLVRRGGEF